MKKIKETIPNRFLHLIFILLSFILVFGSFFIIELFLKIFYYPATYVDNLTTLNIDNSEQLQETNNFLYLKLLTDNYLNRYSIHYLMKLKSGSVLLDKLLLGGYPLGGISMIYGPAATGKTTCSKLTSISTARQGKKIKVLEHGKNYFKYLYPDEATTIHSQSFSNCPIQTKLANEIYLINYGTTKGN